MNKRYARAAALTFLFAFVGMFTGLSACGRSALEGYEQDASPDVAQIDSGDAGDAGDAADDADAGDAEAGTCNAATCPNGCCDAKGKCQNGTLLASCGGPRGVACTDCTAKGFDFCDATRRTCAREVAVCDLTTCAEGCCGTASPVPDAGAPDAGPDAGGTALCFDGQSGKACGAGGNACSACNTAGGEICDPGTRACVSAACSPANCPGCCVGNQCRIGQDNTACGAKGSACTDCAKDKTSCIPTGTVGGNCEGPPPLCSPTTCPTGCCLGDQCIAGDQDTACGKGGLQCGNCVGQSQVCTGQACVTPPPTCTSANCPGCCDAAGVCFAGFLNTRCGSQANACTNCSATGSSCNGALTPRTCNNQQNTCPATYASCPASVTIDPPPAAKGSCAATDLTDARAACGPGAASASCNAYFAFLDAVKPTCSQCLAPFHVTFGEATGIYTCLQPFVPANCNHDTGCAVECSDSSCTQCPAGAKTQCENNVRSGNGQCRPYYQQTACIAPALFSSGAFCNPASYGGNYGSWLQGVGGHYCAP
jgi:hypothetical protein